VDGPGNSVAGHPLTASLQGGAGGGGAGGEAAGGVYRLVLEGSDGEAEGLLE
jgi:hypothetical protein